MERKKRKQTRKKSRAHFVDTHGNVFEWTKRERKKVSRKTETRVNMPTATKNFLIFLSCLLKNPTLKIYLEGKYRNDLNWIFLVALAHTPFHTIPYHSFLIIISPIAVCLCILYTYPVLDILATCTVLSWERIHIIQQNGLFCLVCMGANADECATFHATSNFVAFPHDYSHFLSLFLSHLLIHSRCFHCLPLRLHIATPPRTDQ